MLGRFTERARRVMGLAAEEARSRGHAFVGPEHLLLAMIRDGDGMAVYAVQRSGVSLDTLRTEVERVATSLPVTGGGGTPPFSPEMKHVLELAVQWAKELCHRAIGTENLLLGLMQDGQSAAARALASLGVTFDVARREVEVLTGAQVPFSPENLRLVANSRWRVQLERREAS